MKRRATASALRISGLNLRDLRPNIVKRHATWPVLLLALCIARPMFAGAAANPCADGGASFVVAAPGGGIAGTGRSDSSSGATVRGDAGPGIGGTGRTAGDEAHPHTGGIQGTGRADKSGEGGIHGTGEAGIGGSGRAGESGIQGTGRGPKDPGDGGIQGTGYVRGLFGTVTGYASLCVAGIEVSYDPAIVIGDGKTPTPAIGETVEIVADGKGDRMRAISIARSPVLVGAIDSIDTGAGTMKVLGQAVVFDLNTRCGGEGVDTEVASSGLAAGNQVRISGLRRSDSTIVASRIERSVEDRVLLSGVVSKTGDGWIEVGSRRVDVRGAQLRPEVSNHAGVSLRVGDEVTLRGHLAGASLVADDVRPALAHLAVAGLRRVDVESIAAGSARDITIAGQRLAVPGGTARGRVLVGANVTAGGVLSFDRVRPPVPWHPPGSGQGPPAGAGNGHEPGSGCAPPSNSPPSNAPPPRGDHPCDAAPPPRPLVGSAPDRPERPDRPEFPDRPPPRPPRPGPIEPPPPPPPPPPPRIEAPQVLGMTEKPSLPERVDRPEKPALPDKPERVEKPERPAAPDRVRLPERPPERVFVPSMR